MFDSPGLWSAICSVLYIDLYIKYTWGFGFNHKLALTGCNESRVFFYTIPEQRILNCCLSSLLFKSWQTLYVVVSYLEFIVSKSER